MINSPKFWFVSLCLALPIIGLFAFSNVANCEPISQQLTKLEGNCAHGLHHQPNGPMAILNFCEDAIGVYIGLLYYDTMGAPTPIKFSNNLSANEQKTLHKIWYVDNRMWQEPIWATDVTSYAWSTDGTKLYVATSNIYGSGALYELDLIRKKYKQIVPTEKQYTLEHPGPGYLITKIETEKLFYQLSPWDLEPGAVVKEESYKIETNR